MFKVRSLVFSFAVLSACSSTGDQIEIINATEARVPAESFVKQGDEALIYEELCNLPYHAKFRKCWSESIGRGTVIGISEKRAVVRAESGIKFSKSSKIKLAYKEKIATP